MRPNERQWALKSTCSRQVTVTCGMVCLSVEEAVFEPISLGVPPAAAAVSPDHTAAITQSSPLEPGHFMQKLPKTTMATMAQQSLDNVPLSLSSSPCNVLLQWNY